MAVLNPAKELDSFSSEVVKLIVAKRQLFLVLGILDRYLDQLKLRHSRSSGDRFLNWRPVLGETKCGSIASRRNGLDLDQLPFFVALNLLRTWRR